MSEPPVPSAAPTPRCRSGSRWTPILRMSPGVNRRNSARAVEGAPGSRSSSIGGGRSGQAATERRDAQALRWRTGSARIRRIRTGEAGVKRGSKENGPLSALLRRCADRAGVIQLAAPVRKESLTHHADCQEIEKGTLC